MTAILPWLSWLYISKRDNEIIQQQWKHGELSMCTHTMSIGPPSTCYRSIILSRICIHGSKIQRIWVIEILHFFESWTQFFERARCSLTGNLPSLPIKHRICSNLTAHRYRMPETLWRRRVVVSGVALINEVNRHCTRLVLGWVTGKSSRYVTSHRGQLSLPSLPGR